MSILYTFASLMSETVYGAVNQIVLGQIFCRKFSTHP
jgi:hypothetical protein